MKIMAMILAPLVIAVTPWVAGVLRQEPWTLYMWIGFGGCFGAFAGAFINDRQRQRKAREGSLEPLRDLPA